jgi:RHS repeat-associated protein
MTTGSDNDVDSFSYDPNTYRPTNLTYTIKPSSGSYNVASALTWNANGSLRQFQYTDGNPSPLSQTCTYSADDLSRIASVNCGNSTWAQNFSYDAFGNINKTVPSGATGTSYQAAYSTVTNQVSGGPSYDANGNQLTSTPAALTWNALNQPITVNSTTATYDALGRMVEKGSGSTYTQFVFRPSGAILAVYSGGLTKGTIPLPGGSTAIYNGSGLNYLRHTDWLGSSRLATTWAHAVYSKEAYAPFGETYNEVGTPDRSFTGQDQDVATGSGGAGVYDFLFRKYDPSAGRWLSPDPYGWNAVNQTAPQSLNRYAYAQNDPLSFYDPNGLNICYYGDPADVTIDNDPTDWDDSSREDCAAQGGRNVIIDSSVTVNSADPNSCMASDPSSLACMAVNVTTSFVLVPSVNNGGAPNNGTPWYQNTCVTGALKTGAINAGIDAIGFIPEAGGVARMIGHGAGYVGVVADKLGSKVVTAVGKTAGTVNSAAGISSDWTSWVSAGITVGDFIPVVNEFTTVAALAWDTGVTAYKVYQCPK